MHCGAESSHLVFKTVTPGHYFIQVWFSTVPVKLCKIMLNKRGLLYFYILENSLNLLAKFGSSVQNPPLIYSFVSLARIAPKVGVFLCSRTTQPVGSARMEEARACTQME
jgi:hypothetical protein